MANLQLQREQILRSLKRDSHSANRCWIRYMLHDHYYRFLLGASCLSPDLPRCFHY